MSSPAREAPVPLLPAATLFGARAVYAFNWYNLGPVLPMVGATLAVAPGAWGVILGSFLVGVGLFQIPAGFAAIRFGARRVSILGLAAMGLACAASGAAPTLEWIVVARFLAGVGAAFFFSPGLSLVSSYYPAGRRGPVIGWYNGGFAVGGAVGLFAGATIGLALGWRADLVIGGLTLAAAGGVTALLLPREPLPRSEGGLRALWEAGRGIVRSRSIWALSLGLTGFWGAVFAVAQYFVAFGSVVHPTWGVPLSAALAALVVAVSFPGGPVGGWLAERWIDRRGPLAAFGVAAGLLVLAIPFVGLPGIWGLMVALGFLDGVVFAILYVVPAYLEESRGAGVALGVGIVNSIQVLLGSGLAVAFGYIAAVAGFGWAWGFAAALSVGLLPLLVWVRPTRPFASTGPAASPTSEPGS